MSDFWGAIATGAAGLIGVGLGGGLALLNRRRQRVEDRIQQQLDEFYAPFLGIRMHIQAKSEFRVMLSGKFGEAWPSLFTDARAQGNPSLLKEIEEKHWPAFEKAQDYSNHVLEHEIVPLYNKLVKLFTDKMQFTEASTRTHFGELVEYVEIWNRFFADALPNEALPFFDHREEKIKPLYADVANQVENLTRQLSLGRTNIMRGVQRLSIVLAFIWLIGASTFLWITRPEPALVCTESAIQGVSRLSSNGQQSLNAVYVQGPDGVMYLFPAGTTKPDAVAYFKQRCSPESKAARNILLFALMPAAVGYLLLLLLALAGMWVWHGFLTQGRNPQPASQTTQLRSRSQ
jgi:hypothetical protein